MQLSIVAETVAQIATAMGEALASDTGHDADGISLRGRQRATRASRPRRSRRSRAPISISATASAPALDGSIFDVLRRSTGSRPPQPRRAAGRRRRSPRPRPRLPGRANEGQPVAFAPMQPTPVRAAAPGQANLDLVHDVPLEISAVLGQTELSLREVVAMMPGSVFELDKLSTDPIDLYVNNILIARGEVVVVDDKFAVKISELNPVVDKV